MTKMNINPLTETDTDALQSLGKMTDAELMHEMVAGVSNDKSNRLQSAIHLGAAWTLLNVRKYVSGTNSKTIAAKIGYSAGHLRKCAQLFDNRFQHHAAAQWYETNRTALTEPYSYTDNNGNSHTVMVGFIPAKAEGIDWQISVTNAYLVYVMLTEPEYFSDGKTVKRNALSTPDAIAELRRSHAVAQIDRINARLEAANTEAEAQIIKISPMAIATAANPARRKEEGQSKTTN